MPNSPIVVVIAVAIVAAVITAGILWQKRRNAQLADHKSPTGKPPIPEDDGN